MHEGLPRPRNVEQRIALRRHLAEPAADQHDQIGRLDAREQLRIGADAEVAGVARMPRSRSDARGGTWWRPARRSVRRSAPATRARGSPTSGCRRPARSAASRPRAASAASPCRPGPARSRPARTPARPAPRRARSACPRAARSPPARAGRWSRRRTRATRARGCAPDRRSRSPTSRSSRTPRGSPVPGTRRARASRGRPGRRTRSAASNPACAMWMPGEALVAPGPRVTNTTPGRPVALPMRLRHHGGAALLAADGELDRPVVEGVERGEIALARHAEHVLHAVRRRAGRSGFRRRCGCRHWRAA